MNCREFKDQFDNGLKLSVNANAHLKVCADCETFRDENLQLTQMISSLPNVSAPKDFEFGFRSKLANAQLKRPLSPIWQMLRYVMPLTAAALIFGFVFVNSNLFTQNDSLQIVAEKKDSKLEKTPLDGDSFIKAEPVSDDLVADSGNEDTPVDETPDSPAQNDSTQKEIQTPPIIAENKPKTNNKSNSEDEKIMTLDIKPETDSPKILSKDNAFTAPPETIKKPQKNLPQMPKASASFSAKEILSQLGIQTSAENGQLKVRSVTKNSVGANSGVKVGDLITAIDGQKLSNQQMKIGSVQGKTLKLRRGNKDLYVVIKN